MKSSQITRLYLVSGWLLALPSHVACTNASSQAAPEVVAPTTAQLTRGGPGLRSAVSPDKELYIVAHEDDDLLFMSPDLARSIAVGNTVWVVFLTAGDAGRGKPYWTNREKGIERAYAEMARVENRWLTIHKNDFAGRVVHTRSLRDRPTVQVLFLRLPGGTPCGRGNQINRCQSLRKLWNGTNASIANLADQTTYTRTELVATLHAIFERLAPDRIGVLDPTFAHGRDHSDHLYSARFALTARSHYPAPHEFSMYRTYNIDKSPINLTGAEHSNKAAVMLSYIPYDTNLCPRRSCSLTGETADWTYRQYSKSALSGISGRMRATTGGSSLCFDVRDVLAGNASTLRLVDCSDSLGQTWHIGVDQTIRALNQCLTADSYSPPGGVDEEHKCDAIQGRCVLPKPPLDEPRAVQLAACADNPAQRFTPLSDGRVLGPGGRCLQGVHGAASSGTEAGFAVQLGRCGPDSTRWRWTVEAAEPSYRSQGTDFSEGDLHGDATKTRSFGLADVDGDGDSDACVRRADGVYCALNSGSGHFAHYQRWISAFTDSQQWQADDTGPTVQFADINRDGRADVCGRSARGLVCAHSTGASFAEPALRTTGGDFSDDNGYGQPSRASSVHLADVNGDRAPDVCGRATDGIFCALNDSRGHFAKSTRWLAGGFTDAQGWNQPSYGSTLMFGDLDGDGRADVCARGIPTVICARSVGGKFAEQSRWGFGADYSDREGWNSDISYYGSMRLTDVNGDGRADVCGRYQTGLFCSISLGGVGFDETMHIQPRGFTDRAGWKEPQFGPSIQWADIDGDGHADACGVHTKGLLCAHSP